MKDNYINFEIRQGANMLEMVRPNGEIEKSFPAVCLFSEMDKTTTQYNNSPDGCIGVTFTIA